MSRTRRAAIETDVISFMSEFARFLIAAGITSKRYAAMSRLAYFMAASNHARFGNDRINQSAVAAMTGLTRAQVRGFAKQVRPLPNQTSDRVDIVIEGWTADPTFTDSDSSPKALRLSGGGNSFLALARLYGGDLPARSLLRELQRHGLVSVRDGFVSLRRSAVKNRAEFRLRFISKIMAELIRNETRDLEANSRMRAVQLEARYPTAGEKGRLLMQKRTNEGVRTFLSGLQAAGASVAAASPLPKGRKSKVSRVRLVLITEDSSN